MLRQPCWFERDLILHQLTGRSMAEGRARRLRLPPGDVAAAAVLFVAMTVVRLGAGEDPDASPPLVLALGAMIAGAWRSGAAPRSPGTRWARRDSSWRPCGWGPAS